MPKKKKTTAKLIKKSNVEKNAIDVDIIIDTREQLPWSFKNIPSGISLRNTYIDTLSAGDYCLVGMSGEKNSQEFSVIVERKAKMEEFLGNIGTNWERFKKELEKLSKFSRPVIIIEDDMSKAYARYKCRRGFFNLHPSFILKRVAEIYVEYNIPVFFVSNRSTGEQLALSLFKRASVLDGAD
jgi:ERCC4-type nuclease